MNTNYPKPTIFYILRYFYYRRNR